MRTLSSAALRAMFAEETGDYPVMLLTISHPELAEPIRVSSDPTQRISETETDIIYGTVSREMNFFYMPFAITLPGDSDDAAPSSTLSIDNVTRELTPVIRSITSPASVTMEMVMASDPDWLETVWPDFEVSLIEYDDTVVSGSLTLDHLVAEPFPSGSFTPGGFPAVF